MKFIADKMNLDIFEVLKISNTKPFGFVRFDRALYRRTLYSIDPLYLSWKVKQIGMDAKFIKLSGEINLKVLSFILKIETIRQKINNQKINLKF